MCQQSQINNSVGLCFQKQSNVWNKTFKNKSTAKYHRGQNKLKEHKIFKLKYANGYMTR